jgi:hypothetical protein
MTTKNPFEIRAEMLQLAKEYMDQQYHMNVQFAEKMIKEGRKTIDESKDVYEMYSIKDMMDKAKEMYSFVTDKK